MNQFKNFIIINNNKMAKCSFHNKIPKKLTFETILQNLKLNM